MWSVWCPCAQTPLILTNFNTLAVFNYANILSCFQAEIWCWSVRRDHTYTVSLANWIQAIDAELPLISVKVKCARAFISYSNKGKWENSKELKTNNCLTSNWHWYESDSKTRTALTCHLKPKESQENKENSKDPPPRWYRYCHTSITGGKISSPSQPSGMWSARDKKEGKSDHTPSHTPSTSTYLSTYSVFRRSKPSHRAVNTDWIATQKLCMSTWYSNYSSRLDKRSQCHTSTRKFWWMTIVIKLKMITVTYRIVH